MSSWRLSFASANRGEHLRKLSQVYMESSSSSLKPLEIVQPVGKWLHSQGLRSSTRTYGITEDSKKGEAARPSAAQNCCIEDLGGVDGPKEAVAELHLDNMHISRYLASDDHQSGRRSHEFCHEEAPRPTTTPSDNNIQIHISYRTHKRWSNSGSVALSEQIPCVRGNLISDGTSSYYPSVRNSVQLSLQSSHFNSKSLMGGGSETHDTGNTTGKACNLLIFPFPPSFLKCYANLTKRRIALLFGVVRLPD